MNGSAIKAAVDQVDLGESVHCRPWRHWHRWGFGRGCYRGGVTFYEGPRFYRYGYRHRGGFDVRERERAGVTIRGGEGFRGGSVRGSTTFRSPGEASPRISGGQSGGGRVGGGAQMNTAPTGGGGAAMPGGGGGRGGGGGGGQGRGHGGENKQ
jgi:hypothetical protein